MKLKYIVMALALCLVMACNTDEVECPTCPDIPTLECPEGYTLDKSTDPWTCVADVVPPPEPPEPPQDGPSCGDLKGNFCSHKGTCPDGYEVVQVTWDCNPCCKKALDVKPEDYISLRAGKEIIRKVREDSRTDIYVGIWISVRNFQYAANMCGDVVEEVFGMSPAAMYEFAAVGQKNYDKFNNHWTERLQTQNKHYPEYPEFEKKSDVRKEYWQPFEDGLRVHRTEVGRITDIAQAHPYRDICAYDNIAGWCLCHWRGPLP